MKQNKKTVPVELSYYRLYLLDYLKIPSRQSIGYRFHCRTRRSRHRHFREGKAGGRHGGGRPRGSHARAARRAALLSYALLTEVVEREFADEVAEQEREPFCRRLYPHLNNLFAGYDTSDDTFALSPAHDLLYTELVGTVMLYLESYGVQ